LSRMQRKAPAGGVASGASRVKDTCNLMETR